MISNVPCSTLIPVNINLNGSRFRECMTQLYGWMDGYFVYRRSTLKGHIASNKLCYMMILFNEKFKNI